MPPAVCLCVDCMWNVCGKYVDCIQTSSAVCRSIVEVAYDMQIFGQLKWLTHTQHFSQCTHAKWNDNNNNDWQMGLQVFWSRQATVCFCRSHSLSLSLSFPLSLLCLCVWVKKETRQITTNNTGTKTTGWQAGSITNTWMNKQRRHKKLNKLISDQLKDTL